MRLWLTRRRGDRFHALEEVSLDRFQDLFEADLARQGTRIRLFVDAAGQEIEIKGMVLPPLAQLRKSGHVGTIERRAAEDLGDLVSRLRGNGEGVDAERTGNARDVLAVLDALARARRPLTAIIAA